MPKIFVHLFADVAVNPTLPEELSYKVLRSFTWLDRASLKSAISVTRAWLLQWKRLTSNEPSYPSIVSSNPQHYRSVIRFKSSLDKMSLPQTMKAVVFDGLYRVSVQDRPVPQS